MYTCICKERVGHFFRGKIGFVESEPFSTDISRWIVQIHLTYDAYIAWFRFNAVSLKKKTIFTSKCPRISLVRFLNRQWIKGKFWLVSFSNSIAIYWQTKIYNKFLHYWIIRTYLYFTANEKTDIAQTRETLGHFKIKVVLFFSKTALVRGEKAMYTL